jgi:hypothetical protein
MIHTPDYVRDIIRNIKLLRGHMVQPSKARAHRYERRKVRGLIRLGDWSEDPR